MNKVWVLETSKVLEVNFYDLSLISYMYMKNHLYKMIIYDKLISRAK